MVTVGPFNPWIETDCDKRPPKHLWNITHMAEPTKEPNYGWILRKNSARPNTLWSRSFRRAGPTVRAAQTFFYAERYVTKYHSIESWVKWKV